MATTASFASGNHEMPDKVTVYCDPHSCGNHSHTFREKCWLVDPDDEGKRIYVHGEEAADHASWLQPGDAVLASNVDADGNRAYVADFVIDSMDARNMDGTEMLMLEE